jgi:NitT/TauT family transport system permease protein
MKRLINRYPDRSLRLVLMAAPFILIVIAYIVGFQSRHAENPNDKLLPSLTKMVNAVERHALEPSARTGEYLFWVDTGASLRRLLIGVGLSALIGLVIGIGSGVIPYLSASISPFTAAVSMIPPMAVLPILFIVFGLGEVAKIILIMFGIAPFMVRDMELRAREIPSEQIIKAQTLGASSWQIITRVILPQLLPRLLTAIRLSLGPAWLYVIASEAIAATEGLGYRIFLVRRYLAMDVILPYVLWITALALLMDLALRKMQASVFPWAQTGPRAAEST